MYKSIKTFTHAQGFSACFRQWRAKHSHCKFLHGYALQVEIAFSAETLDERNWVVDFGGLDEVKAYLAEIFDHKTLIAEDDPALELMKSLDNFNVCDLVILKDVGCEAFAEHIYRYVRAWSEQAYGDRVTVEHVKVSEHGGNSAVYQP